MTNKSQIPIFNDQNCPGRNNTWVFEPQQRAHSPQLAAGLASEYKIRSKILTVEDSLQLAAGFFNFGHWYLFDIWDLIIGISLADRWSQTH